MFKPEITSHADHGVPAQSISIPGHGTYDARTDTLELVTEHLAHLSVRELRSRMIRAFHCFEGKSAKHYLDGLRRAELLFIAAEYPSLYLPGMVQALGLKCDTEGRYWVPPTPEADEPASPFVADPENPTDAEIASAIQRGLADGSIIDSTEFLAQAQAAGHYHDPLGKYDYCTTDHSTTQDAPKRAGRDDSDRCGVCHRDAHRPRTGYQGHPYTDPKSRKFSRTVNVPRSSTPEQQRRAQIHARVYVPGAVGRHMVTIVAKSRCGLAFIGDDGRERPVADILL